MSVKPTDTGAELSPEQIEAASEAKLAADKTAADEADAKRVQDKVDKNIAATEKPTKKEKPAAGKIPAPEESESDDEQTTMHRIGNKFTIAGLALAIIGIAIRNIL